MYSFFLPQFTNLIQTFVLIIPHTVLAIDLRRHSDNLFELIIEIAQIIITSLGTHIRNRHIRADQETLRAPDAAPDETIADPCPQVETTLISREENAAISRAIMDLPPRGFVFRDGRPA